MEAFLSYFSACTQEFKALIQGLIASLAPRWRAVNVAERRVIALSLLSTTCFCILLSWRGNKVEKWYIPGEENTPLVSAPIPSGPRVAPPPKKPVYDLNPVRPLPAKFPLNTRMPTRAEAPSSGTLASASFSPETDLVEIFIDSVWWESDNDDASGDTENDHLMHKSLELPFRRLVKMINEENEKSSKGVVLKVQDTYREHGVHHAKSLHKHGRAIDLTTGQTDDLRTPGIPLSKLGKLCWAAGFDWVFYEAKGGHHIHVSQKP